MIQKKWVQGRIYHFSLCPLTIHSEQEVNKMEIHLRFDNENHSPTPPPLSAIDGCRHLMKCLNIKIVRKCHSNQIKQNL